MERLGRDVDEEDRPRRPDEDGSDERPTPESGDGTGSNEEPGGWTLFARDVLVSILAVALLGLFLFAISGVWPPMVAIESGSMEPNMEINDLAFVVETDRFPPEAASQVGPGDTGVVSAHVGNRTGYEQFGASGDVIVFRPNGNGAQTPVIHRAMFWVDEGEDWTERANASYLRGVTDCHEIASCPAENAGFITKGDNNPAYDQLGEQINRPIDPSWIVGTAEVRIPMLGWFRLQL